MMKKNINKINKVIYTTFVSIFTSLIFIVDLYPNKGIYLKNNDPIYIFFAELNNSIHDLDLTGVFMIILIFNFFYNSLFNNRNTKKQYIFSGVISIIFTVLYLIGEAFSYDNTLHVLYSSNSQLLKTIVLGIGYFFLFMAIILKIININFNIPKKNDKKSNNRNNYRIKGHLIRTINKYHLILVPLFIIIVWLPKIIIYYPTLATGDTLDSLAQFFGIRKLCWSAKAIELIDNSVIINKHHSVLFTMILGAIVKIGKLIKSYSLGIFMFNIFQISILVFIFTILIHYMIKEKIPAIIIIISLLYISFSPIISSYAMTAIKDTLASILVMSYNFFIYKLIKNDKTFFNNKNQVIMFIINILLVLMLKNNGLNIILFCLFILIITERKSRVIIKKISIVFLIPLVLFYCYDKILLENYFKITGTHSKEKYSIQFQQIARLASNNKSAISNTDKKIINKVLNYESIAQNYDPDLSDNVKNTYRLNIKGEDLKLFWDVYYKYFKKYPTVYMSSFLNSTYAYYYPFAGETHGINYLDSRLGDKSPFKLNLLDETKQLRDTYDEIEKLFTRLPFFCLFRHVAFYEYFLLFVIIFIIKKKNYKYLNVLTSLIFISLSCYISPVNGSLRYLLSLIFSIPLLFLIIYDLSLLRLSGGE